MKVKLKLHTNQDWELILQDKIAVKFLTLKFN